MKRRERLRFIRELQERSRRRRGGAAAPTPLEQVVAIGPFGMWRADAQYITIATGVSQWDDMSGNGRHLVQATTTRQPTHSATGGLRGFGYVETSGGTSPNNQHLRALFTLAQPAHLFVVARKVDDTSSVGVTKSLLDGGVANKMRVIVPNDTTIQAMAGAAVPLSIPCVLTGWRRIEVKWLDDDGAGRADDAAYTAGDVGPSTGGIAGLCVGAYGDTSNGTIHAQYEEIILFDRILSAGEVALVQAYLQESAP